MKKNISIVEGEDPDYDDDGSGWTVVKPGSRPIGHGNEGKTKKKPIDVKMNHKSGNEKKKEHAKRVEEARGILESTAVYKTTTIYEQFDQVLQEDEEKQKRKDEKRKQRERAEYEEERIQEHRKIEFHTDFQDDNVQIPKFKKLKKGPKKQNLTEVKKAIGQLALQISIDDIKSSMYTWRENYPQDGNIQLKKLAEYMERSFQKAKPLEYDEKEEGGNPWWSKRDIPFSVIPTNLVNEVAQWISGLEENDISEYTWFLFQTWISSSGKKGGVVNGVGILTLLQIIIRKFPFTMAEITPHIQGQFTSKSKSGDVIYRKQDVMYIMTAIAQSLETNPRISIYSWFELLLPSLLNQTPDPFLWNVIETYIDQLEPLCNEKNWFKVPTNSIKEYHTSPDKFVALIVFLNSEIVSKDKKTIQSKLKVIFPKLTEATVFYSADSPRIYFPKILSIVVQPTETEESPTEESPQTTKTQSGERAVLNILALSLLRCDQCFPQLARYYAQYHVQSHCLLLHFFANWEKLFANVKQNRKQEVIKKLTEVCKTIMDTNLRLRENRYVEDGKKIGVRVLNISREQTTVVDNTCKQFLQQLGKTAKKVKQQQSPNSRGFYWFLLILVFILIVVIVYVTGVGGVILQKTKKGYL